MNDYSALKYLLKHKEFDTNELFDPRFPEQKIFCDDPAKHKALHCTRRAAKSYTAGLYMVETCLKYPDSNCLFIGLTRQSALDIIDKDILQVINRKHSLGMELNKASLTYTFPNGSIIRVGGVDTSEDEMNKLFGKKYKLVCVDEGSLYTVNMRHLIYDVLGPAMADEEGTICFFGTSSNMTQGLFFDITFALGKTMEAGWSVHRWSAHQNPFINWQKQLDEIAKNRPLYMETPQFRQWYLNEWVIETDKLVYKFHPDKNLFRDLPYPQSKGWSYVLSCDLGWEDDTAIVLSAYHENDPCFYVLKTFAQKHMTFDMVERKLLEFLSDKRYPCNSVIIDGANKQGVETMTMRSNILFEYADKLGKSDHIEIMNGDLIQGKVKIHQDEHDLIDEMMALVWQTAGDKIKYPRKEHPSLPNHRCDALLYGWFNGWHFLSTPAKKATIPGTVEYIKEQEDLHKEAIMERIKREQALKEGGHNGWIKDASGQDPWHRWED